MLALDRDHSGQPRAVVFHVKDGREHCHVIWSRIDVQAGKARHLAYDHDKLMMATREFAAEHGIKLPAGYYEDEPGHQLSLYEKVQQDQTGLGLDERKAVVTDLWRRSDSAAAFVSALAENGYILATGKRPFLLVDLYGHVNALPKLIDDREVRTSDVREFLGEAYDPEGLPTVEEAQALAAQHRQALEDFEKARIASGKEDELKQRQPGRRAELEKRIAALTVRQRRQLQALNDRHKGGRQASRAAYLAETRRIRIERGRRRPKGLAAFLAKVSGVELIRKKVQRYRDRKRYEAYRAARRALRDRQEAQLAALVLSHQMQALDMERQARALAQVEKRERQSLETVLMKERQERINGRHEHMPPVGQPLEDPSPQTGEKAPEESRDESQADASEKPRSLTDELNAAAQEGETLTKKFRQATTNDQDETQSGDGGSAGGMKPPPEAEQTRRVRSRERPRRRRRGREEQSLSKEFERAADEERGESDDGDGERAGGAPPAPDDEDHQHPRTRRLEAEPSHQEPDKKDTLGHIRRARPELDPDCGR